MTTPVRDFVMMAFAAVGITIEFKGQGVNEVGIDVATGKEVVRVNPKFYRPAEVDLLIGDPAKAVRELGWEPKVQLNELCEMMVQADMKRVSNSTLIF